MKKKNESNHPEDGLDRRSAIKRILSIAALAAGVGSPAFNHIFAQEKPKKKAKTPPTKTPQKQVKPSQQKKGKTTANRKATVLQKSNSDEVKTLKVLLEKDVQVFENEYGRITPVVQKRIDDFYVQGNIPADLAGQNIPACVTNFDLGIDMQGLVTGGGIWWCSGTNTCSGQTLDGDGDGGTNPCSGTNSCTRQSCPKLGGCDDNTCKNQKCDFTTCDKNKSKIVSVDIVEQYKTDPYIQLLFNEFNVQSSVQLVNAIESRLNSLYGR